MRQVDSWETVWVKKMEISKDIDISIRSRRSRWSLPPR
jgi:hypothetical protein